MDQWYEAHCFVRLWYSVILLHVAPFTDMEVRSLMQNYSQELYWCDSLLYDALVTMSLAFLFIMVNWTAQLNKNTW